MERNINVVRAWKDAAYRSSLSEADLAELPQNPAGTFDLDLSEAELNLIAGGEEAGIELGIISIPKTFPAWICTAAPCTFTSLQRQCGNDYTNGFGCPDFTNNGAPRCRMDIEVGQVF
jgi:mersacidin/lichenicidin family type 2 lantibiotic